MAHMRQKCLDSSTRGDGCLLGAVIRQSPSWKLVEIPGRSPIRRLKNETPVLVLGLCALFDSRSLSYNGSGSRITMQKGPSGLKRPRPTMRLLHANHLLIDPERAGKIAHTGDIPSLGMTC